MKFIFRVVIGLILVDNLYGHEILNQFSILSDSYSKTSTLCTQLLHGIQKAHSESPLIYDERLPEKPIVIVVPSYKNAQWYKENLNSIFLQNYTNYRVVYVDDLSPDNTGLLVEKYVKSKGQNYRFTLIKNKKRKLAMANIYNAVVNYCQNDEIVVMVDGDDFLAQPDVLKYINHVYSTQNVWLTYGSNYFLSRCEPVGWAASFPKSVVTNNKFRAFKHGLTHMRTFYAWLFKKINMKDLMYKNGFVPMTYDVAMFLPMIEMAGNRHLFIDKILYFYNDLNQISDFKVNGRLQWSLNLYLRRKKRYQPLRASCA